MKITKRQLKKLITESIDKYGLVDKVADKIIEAGGKHADLKNAYELAVTLEYAMENMLGILTIHPNFGGGVQIDMVVSPLLSKSLLMRNPDISVKPYPRNPNMHRIEYLVGVPPNKDFSPKRKYRY